MKVLGIGFLVCLVALALYGSGVGGGLVEGFATVGLLGLICLLLPVAIVLYFLLG